MPDGMLNRARPDGSDYEGDDGADLATTGRDLRTIVIVAAVLMAGGTVALIAAGRRRTRETE